MKLTRNDVLHLSRLGNLELKPSELRSVQTQLSDTIAAVATLEKVKTEKLAETNQVTNLKNVSRDDQSRLSLSQSAATANAPAVHKGFFKVRPLFNLNE